MAIDKALTPQPYPTSYPQEEVIDVEVIDEDDQVEDGSTVTELEGGGVLVDFDPNRPTSSGLDFGANMVETMSDKSLGKMASLLIGKFDTDKMSRSDWEKTYKDGIKLLGLDIEDRTRPFDGACGITHPILAEAAVRFQSHAIGELFPEGGPARTKIRGKATPEKTEQGFRVEEYMNHLIQEEMVEFQEEMDRLLWALPIAGSAFKKVLFDGELDRPVSTFVPAEDVVVSYGATSLATATRVTHVMREDINWIRARQASGFYSNVKLGTPSPETESLKQEQDNTIGETGGAPADERYVLLEMHVSLIMSDYDDPPTEEDHEKIEVAIPYIVTIDKASAQVMSIRRNWLPDDDKKKKRQHFSHYQYIPGFGFYGLGLIHLLGGTAKGATSILRQLVDAGTFATLPGGFKTRGLRVTGDSTPIAPGEWRDVDVPSGKIQDNLMKAPYGEPSAVLFQLMNGIIEEGRRFASLTDMNISGQSGDLPTGTALALIERSMKVMTAIQRRLHKGLRDEFTIIVGLIQQQSDLVYPYEVDGGEDQLKADFDSRIDVIPVSDPNSSTAAHRIMKAQAGMDIAKMLPPGDVQLKTLGRYALEMMEIPNAKDIIPLETDLKSMDPVSENMMLLSLAPVKAFPDQNHQAHIQVHMLGMQDPKVQAVLADSPTAQASFGAMMAHVTEHVGYQYRLEIEQSLGVPLQPEGEPLPPEMEAQYSSLVAEAATKLFQKNTAQQASAEAEQDAQDPIVQMRIAEQNLKELTEQNRASEKAERLQLDKAKLLQKDSVEGRRLELEEDLGQERIRGELLGEVIRAASESEKLTMEERIKLTRMAIDMINSEATSIAAERSREDDKEDRAINHIKDIAKELR